MGGALPGQLRGGGLAKAASLELGKRARSAGKLGGAKDPLQRCASRSSFINLLISAEKHTKTTRAEDTTRTLHHHGLSGAEPQGCFYSLFVIKMVSSALPVPVRLYTSVPF